MLFLIIVINCAIAILADHDIPKIKVNEGKVEGYYLKTVSGRDIEAFEGIPYAERPIGNLRFEPPQPKKPWIGTWKATVVNKCLQYAHSHPNYVAGNEDCLYVNVYKPKGNVQNLDVIVYIHGGAFMFNSGGNHRPNYIMDRNIILVTLNYRLGPLGFLSTEDAVLPGNNGLKDQNLALTWVKKNAHHFGGNPDSITIAGMSAGGASVHYHTLSPLSKGLFHKAISQSGVATNPWALTDNARQKAFRMGDILGCPTGNSKEMVQCLKTRPAYQIVEYVKHFMVWLYNPFTPFGPVVDKWSENPFLPEHPVTIMQNKKMSDVPMILSFVDCEGLYPAADFVKKPEYLDYINSNWNELAPYILDYNDTIPEDHQNDVSQKILSAYLSDEGKDITMETFPNLVEMLSDRMFLKDINKVAQIYASSLSSPVFSYKFSYLGEFGLPKERGNDFDFECTSHADDTLYVVPMSLRMRSTETDTQISELMIDVWVSFAQNGVPKLQDVEWPPLPKMQRKTIDYLHIASPENMKYESVDDLGNGEFWDTLPLQEDTNLFVAKDEL